MTIEDIPDKDESTQSLEKQAALEKESKHKREPKTVHISDLELEHLKREIHEYKDKYLRSIAEAENLRKRLNKERQEMMQMAIQSVIVDFLTPLDHMEKALSFTDQMSEEVNNWATGFKMILNQFKEALTNNDVHAFKSVGMPFDPHHHEAVEMIETTEFPEGTVVEENTKGYKMGSKIIRPARVKVAKKSSSEPHVEENLSSSTNE